MKNRSRIHISTIIVVALALCFPSYAQSPAVKNVVLVHGAFADGSSYAKVIPLLEARGLNVIAVQNPLRRRSMSVTSGRCLRNASMASRPLEASMTRVMSG